MGIQRSLAGLIWNVENSTAMLFFLDVKIRNTQADARETTHLVS